MPNFIYRIFIEFIRHFLSNGINIERYYKFMDNSNVLANHEVIEFFIRNCEKIQSTSWTETGEELHDDKNIIHTFSDKNDSNKGLVISFETEHPLDHESIKSFGSSFPIFTLQTITITSIKIISVQNINN
jgi:hypothetical protein